MLCEENIVKTYHPSLAAGRWFTMSLAAQMGNVASEYERALIWKDRKDADRFEHAFARMLELRNHPTQPSVGQ